MSGQNYTTAIVVGQSPAEAFAAINNVRGWWSGDIEGVTDQLGAEFTYRVPDVHYCKMRIVELLPGKKVVWDVLDSDIRYTQAKTEWNDTRISFEIFPTAGKTEVRFTHVGLVPAYECYSSCSDAWGSLIRGSLRQLIATGRDQPNLFAPKEAGTR
jgi:hypothetical protein